MSRTGGRPLAAGLAPPFSHRSTRMNTDGHGCDRGSPYRWFIEREKGVQRPAASYAPEPLRRRSSAARLTPVNHGSTGMNADGHRWVRGRSYCCFRGDVKNCAFFSRTGTFQRPSAIPWNARRAALSGAALQLRSVYQDQSRRGPRSRNSRRGRSSRRSRLSPSIAGSRST